MQDLPAAHMLIGAEQGARLELVQRVAHDDPAERQGRIARRVPQRRSRGDLHRALFTAVLSPRLSRVLPREMASWTDARGATEKD